MKTNKLGLAEHKLMSIIAKRAVKIGQSHQPDFMRTVADIMMDLECCNETIPLDLERLAAADDYNFCHDVFGIARHLNRHTRQMEDCFVPRFALPVAS